MSSPEDSNDKNRDNKSNNNQNDPFNFFKMSPEPGSSGGKNRPQFPKIPVWAIILIIFAILFIANYVIMARSDSLIPFSEFKEHISSGEITRVQIGSKYFTGYTSNLTSSSNRNSFDLGGASGVQVKSYRTVGLLTEDFIKLLDGMQVVYSIQAEESNGVLDFILQWVLPFVLFFFMWQFLMKRMGGGGIIARFRLQRHGSSR